MSYEGSCHCGKIAYAVEGEIDAFGFGTDPEDNETAAINARCLQDVDLSTISINHYDGRSA